MEQELKNALKLITEKCKEPNYHQTMNAKSLSQRIESLKADFLHYVDYDTIWYSHGVRIKKNPDDSFKDHPDYRLVELSERERKNALESLQWLLRDVEQCIGHLENK
jgi:hypothetical protein